MKNDMNAVLRALRARLRGTIASEPLEREMDDEIRFHLEMATARNIASGMSEREARRQARITFGGIETMKEEGREAQRSRWLENIALDVQFAIRSLGKSPAFTVAALLTVAIGIAANVSVFSVVNAVLLRPLPFPQPNDVRYVGWDWGKNNTIPSATLFQYDFMRRNSKAVDAAAVFDQVNTTLGNGANASGVRGMRVTGDFFRVIDLQPARGRSIGEADAKTDAPVIILGDAIWRTRFASDPNILGRSVRLDSTDRVVIGVMPATYKFPAAADNLDFLIPFEPTIDQKDEGHNSMVLARFRHDLTQKQRDDDITRLGAMMRQEHPELAAPQESYHVFTHAEAFASDVRSTLFVLLGAVMFVLLIGAANTSNLMLMRASGRTREIAVRAALGSGRRRIIQQLLIEGLVLSTVASVIGIIGGSWALKVLLRLAPKGLAPARGIGLDGRVLAFVVLVAIITGMVFGLAAVVPALRVDLQDTLRQGSRGSTGGGTRIRNMLVVVETAFAVVLLCGAGLLITSFARIISTDAGFDPHQVYAVRVGKLPADVQDAASQLRLENVALDAIRRVPGVDHVAAASNFPLERGLNFPTSPADNPDNGIGNPEWRAVTPDYFAALGIRLKAGPAFNEHDVQNAPRVAILNEKIAQKFWPGQNPIGKRINIGNFKGKWLAPGLEGATEVVGIVSDIREIKLNAPARSTIMIPRAQSPDGMQMDPAIIVHTQGTAEIGTQLRAAVAQADPRLAAVKVEPMSSIVSRSLAEPRFQMMIIGVFAASALLLAAIGIYGVIAAAVQQSTREIGVRLALGATRMNVTIRVLRRSLLLVGGGAVIGTVLSMGLTRFIASMLYNVTPHDPITWAGVVLVLCVVGGVAGWIPARRASRIDPGLALRSEQA
jgi:predicted permease